jgi:hypothetical protein
MKHFLLCIAFIFIDLCATFAQKPTDETDFIPKNKGIELGLNITSTLAGFFNSGGDRTGSDPYFLSLKIASPTGAIRIGAYGALKKENTFQCNNNICGERVLNNTAFNLRAGYEWRTPISQRFLFFWGIDGIFKWDANETVTNFQGQGGSALIANRKIGFGGGGVAGVQFWLSKRIALSTETSLYAVAVAGSNELSIPPATSKKTPVSSFEIMPILPSSLFFTFRF